MKMYDLEIRIEELDDDGDYRYLATSPQLPGLLVVGDTPEEVQSLAPQIAAALITSIQAAGDPLPETLRMVQSLPFTSHIAVPA